MTAVALPLPRLHSRAELHVERTDIAFHNVTRQRVAIAITVRNHGTRRSEETIALVSAAPLGAFVPWRPLTMLTVPALDSDESHVLHAEAPRPAVKALGPPDRVTPRQLLTALGDEDQEPERTPGRRRQRLIQQLTLNLGDLGTGQLPADLFELMGRGGVHWAGNLNVFVGGKAVERHLAQALRVYPDCLNMAMFMVGSGRDAYRFELHGDGVAWDATLYAMDSMLSLGRPDSGAAVRTGAWMELRNTTMMMLALCPPRDCGQGSVEVHVTQRSTGETAVVEFSLDPNAAGAGCYVVG